MPTVGIAAAHLKIVQGRANTQSGRVERPAKRFGDEVQSHRRCDRSDLIRDPECELGVPGSLPTPRDCSGPHGELTGASGSHVACKDLRGSIPMDQQHLICLAFSLRTHAG